MKTVCKKLLCLMLVAMLLVSAVPAAFAAEGDYTFWYELWVDGVRVDNKDKTVQVAPNTEFTEAQIKAQAEAFWPDYFSNYEFDKITESTKADADHNGVRVWLKTPEECQHENTVTGTTATCTAAGTTVIRCSDCKTVVSSTSTDALGHDLDANGECKRSGCDYVEQQEEDTATGKLVISVYNWDGTNRNWVKDVEKPAGTYKLTEAFASEIYPGQKIKYDWGSKSGSTVTVTDTDVNVVLAVTPLQTSDGQNVYKLRVYTNDRTSNYKEIDIYEGEGILAAIKNAGITPKYEDHVLVGYLNHMNGNSGSYLTIYDVADGNDANSDGVIKVWADWREKTDDDDEDYEYGEGGGLGGDANEDPIYDVVLYIYTNGKTSSYAKKVTSSSMGKHTKDGVLNRDEVELVVEEYFKTTEDTKYYGLFNKYYWNSGNYLTENAKYSIELDPDETNYVYVMVKDAKAYVADSSNPKTGDTIMIAVSTMALAAAGVVSMMALKKRKMI